MNLPPQDPLRSQHAHLGRQQPTNPMTNPTTPQQGETPRTDAIAHRGYDAMTYTGIMTDHARTLERELAEAKGEQPINTHRRLFDLVRNCRAQLHEEDLITDEEYDWLCGHEFEEDKGKSGSPSPRRLEDYDQLRADLARVTKERDTSIANHIATVQKFGDYRKAYTAARQQEGSK